MSRSLNDTMGTVEKQDQSVANVLNEESAKELEVDFLAKPSESK